jgi:hypothetical protein
MSQPSWKLLDVLGDVNPIDNGGMLVYEDTTGVYPPEAVVIRVLDEDRDDDDGGWIVYRFPLERCTYGRPRGIDGVLSDNEYHPEAPAWFADSLESVASFVGASRDELIGYLCSPSPSDRAQAYQAIGDYHGFINLDHDPITDFDRSEIEARYGAKV